MASALPKCSIMSGCGTRIVLRGQKSLALCDRCPCFGSLFPPLAALTFAASSIICAFGLASAAPRSPYRHLELCGIALTFCPGGVRRCRPCRGFFASCAYKSKIRPKIFLFLCFPQRGRIFRRSVPAFSRICESFFVFSISASCSRKSHTLSRQSVFGINTLDFI